METYTIEELLQLRKYLNSSSDLEKASYLKNASMPLSALLNAAQLIENYKKDGPEIIRCKILEFADIGRLDAPDGSTGIHAYTQIYDMMYNYTLEDLFLYVGSDFEPILTWRCNLLRR
jgi:hypothetical protein